MINIRDKFRCTKHYHYDSDSAESARSGPSNFISALLEQIISLKRSIAELGFGMSEECASVTTWELEEVTVTARLVPRYAFMSASIDVEVGGKLVLATGGVYKFVGVHTQTFERNGKLHRVELSWKTGGFRAFPIRLAIDGAPLLESDVRILNWWLMYWPFLILSCVAWGASY
jgi:hypothetical protein